MPRYVIENWGTGHVFCCFDNLKTAIEYYHKIPRRVNGTIALTDLATGEIVKYKLGKAQLKQIAQK